MEKFRNRILRVFALCAAAAIVSCTAAGCGKEVSEEMSPPIVSEPVVTEPPPITTVPDTTTEATTTTEPPPVEPDPLEKYLEYYEQNNDFIGWIKIEGLEKSNGDLYIDYPVVQTTDNSYYLDRNFNKEKDKKGTIYADYAVPITGLSRPDNITLYGHSNKDKTFFRQLLEFKSLSKLKKAYIIDFDTRWEEAQYVIIGCFLTGIYENQDDIPLFEYFKCRTFETEEDYNYFYENVMLRNYYTTGIECEYGDQFLTLSTCSYEFSDSRFVVVARKVREGEDPTVYEDTYEKNPDKHMPKKARKS